MELKQQVSNLELSKRLKELNCPQESLFYWVKMADDYELKSWDWEYLKDYENCAAFSVAELGEMLKKSGYDFPWFIKDDIFRNGETWQWSCLEEDGIEDTEVDARAKMVAYLKENNLI